MFYIRSHVGWIGCGSGRGRKRDVKWNDGRKRPGRRNVSTFIDKHKFLASSPYTSTSIKFSLIFLKENGGTSKESILGIRKRCATEKTFWRQETINDATRRALGMRVIDCRILFPSIYLSLSLFIRTSKKKVLKIRKQKIERVSSAAIICKSMKILLECKTSERSRLYWALSSAKLLVHSTDGSNSTDRSIYPSITRRTPRVLIHWIDILYSSISVCVRCRAYRFALGLR